MQFVRSRAARVAGVVLLLVGGLGCQSDEEKRSQHLTRAETYLEAEQYPEAIIEYKSALQIDPNLAAAHWGLARAHLENQQAREGFWELRETVRLAPENIEARVRFGQLSILAGELDESLAQADAVIEMEPEHVRAHLLRGQALEAQKKIRPAQNAYERAVELAAGGDDEATAVNLLANFHARRGDMQAAGPFYRRLAEVRPTFSSFVALAGFLVQERLLDEAEDAYRKGLEVAEADERARAHGFLASFYFNQDRFDDAAAVLEGGIEELEDPLDLIYLQARFHNARGETEKANAMMEQATREMPDDPRPFIVLSTYQGRRGLLAEALTAAEKAVELAPDNVAARLRKAELLVDLGFREKDRARLDEGRAVVESVLEDNPNNPGALLIRAKIEMAQSQVKEAVATLHAALDARPDWAQAHYLLGSALAVQGDRTAARTELARALEIDASLAEPRKVLARIHHSLGEHEYAVEEARRFLQARPGDTKTRIVLAQSLVNLGRRDEALAELETIEPAARTPDVLYAFGQLRLATGQLDKARQSLERALERAPANAEILRSLLVLDGRENRFQESVERIRAAVEANPTDGRLHQLNGLVALASGRGDEAEKSFLAAIDHAPDDLTGYERLANFYGRTGRVQQATETYEKALERRPERAQLHYMLGVLYEFSGKREEAVERYEEAIRRKPDLGEAKNNLAYLYAEQGLNLDRALDLAQEAKALLPDNPNAADTLGWVLYKRGIPSAAISFLKEAESGIEMGEPTLGLVRHHLALAYEANDEPLEARKVAQRALADLEAAIADAKARNLTVGPEPPWATAMREMLDRLDGHELPPTASKGKG